MTSGASIRQAGIAGSAASMPSAASGPAATTLCLRAPWLGAQRWRAEGVVAGRGPFSGAGTRGDSPGTQSAGDPMTVPVPIGFSGRLTLHDGVGRPLGHLQLVDAGTPTAQVTSPNLSVQTTATGDLLLDRSRKPVQVYLRLPASLRATSVIAQSRDGSSQTFKLTSPGGLSCQLDPAFNGKLVVVGAPGTPPVAIQMSQLGSDAVIDVKSSLANRVRTSSNLVDITILSLMANAGIG